MIHAELFDNNEHTTFDTLFLGVGHVGPAIIVHVALDGRFEGLEDLLV
jgi:hypothetical protein